jgi:hypothetical protein
MAHFSVTRDRRLSATHVERAMPDHTEAIEHILEAHRQAEPRRCRPAGAVPLG